MWPFIRDSSHLFIFHMLKSSFEIDLPKKKKKKKHLNLYTVRMKDENYIHSFLLKFCILTVKIVAHMALSIKVKIVT